MMIDYSVNIPPRVVAALRRDAAAAVPAECCGAILGTILDDVIDVRCAVPVHNEASCDHRYLIDADVVLRLERQASCADQRLIGFYHSHPVGDAFPSPLDLELACPGFVYLIVRPHQGALRAWRLNDDRSGFQELTVAVLAAA
jgi:proteasome lid subunit RPN8/RPN11